MLRIEPTERGTGGVAPASDPAREAELLRRIGRGDAAAFAPLYDGLAPRAYGLALRIARDPRTAQDAVQEAFLRVWTHAARFDATRGSACAWVLGIVRNATLDQVRSESAHDRALRRSLDAAEPRAACADPESRLASARSEAGVRAALEQLPAAQRRTLEIAYFHDQSHAQIARREGVPLGTVKTRIRDGLVRLRRLGAGGTT